MNFTPFDQAIIAHQRNADVVINGEYPQHLEDILHEADCVLAASVIEGWDGYQPTSLHTFDGFAYEIGIKSLFYKDESTRFGLGSFKALGGAYAVLRLLSQEIPKLTRKPASDEDIHTGRYAEVIKDLTVVTATDGNHGRSVAWGAQQFGCPCKIYMHEGVSNARARAIEDLGAEVVWINGNYDVSVHHAATDASANGWFIVSDTSYEGYMDLPRHVMAGYSVMASETVNQLPGQTPPSHVFVQGGCGGLAAAVSANLWHVYGKDRPRFVIVEPVWADCLYLSAVNAKPTMMNIVDESIMAGLSCGEVSLLGWEILSQSAEDFMTITDDLVGPVMRQLADGGTGTGTGNDKPIVAGESAVAGLAGLIAARRSPELSSALGLDENSTVLVFGTEGATDPEIYQSIVGRTPQDVLA